jgi:hypothetical protein
MKHTQACAAGYEAPMAKMRRCNTFWVVLLLLKLLDCSAFHSAYGSARFKAHDRRMSQARARPSTCLPMWSADDELQGADRIKACIPYMLPLIDGDIFGKYVYERIPILGTVSDFFIGPLVNIHDKVPFFSIIFFVALTLGTRFNTEMDRNVRFSAQQAALIDAVLIVPEIIRESFLEDPVPRYLAEPCSNFVWYAYATVIIYCVYSNLTGKRPDEVPYISPLADLLTGPF